MNRYRVVPPDDEIAFKGKSKREYEKLGWIDRGSDKVSL